MNIICNTCVGGRIYEYYKLQYTNPFIWNAINTPDFMLLVENYNKINFNNFKLIYKDDIYQINIDNLLTVTYPHYKYGKDITTPTIKHERYGTRLYLDTIDQYIIEKYKTRLSRLLNCKENPIFILIKGTTFGKNIKCLDKDIEYFMNIKTPYKKIVYTDKLYNNNKVINNTYIVNGKFNINATEIAKKIINTVKL